LQYMPLQHVRLILVLTQGEDSLPDEIFSRCGSIPRQSSYALGYLLHHPEYKVKAWHDWIRIKEGLKGCSSVV
ncbi:MAG: hypothetical protein KGL58_05905, partial [Pseudomonadota bacterium]|nr:hypothetical protein [Pseudomonadota bacterium]